MIRSLIAVLALLCLTLAPAMAATQLRIAADMGQAISSQTMVAAPSEDARMASRMTGHAMMMTPTHMDSHTPCFKDTALCAWACTAGFALAPAITMPSLTSVAGRIQSPLLSTAMAGMSPTPDHRPPNPARL